MTLHETVETMKKMGIGSAIGLVVIILLVITVRVGMFVKDVLYPEKPKIANASYGKLPVLVFPDSEITNNFTYTLNTVSGGFEKFPDRLNVFPLNVPEPAFGNDDKARQKAAALEFTNESGELLPEVQLGEQFEWEETRGIQRKLTFNIVSFDFIMDSNFLTSLSVINALNLPTETEAIALTEGFLTDIQLLYPDIDFSKTQNTEKKVNYYTYPQVYTIQNSEMVPATSLSEADIIRVDLYQKDVEYDLDTGFTGENKQVKRQKMKLPIMYPQPPYSTMTFWVGSGLAGPTIVKADFSHKSYTVPKGEDPTYEIKTPEEAFEELKNGEGYVASFTGSEADTEILINNAFLAYYIGREEQKYLMPVYVFEGDKGFFSYVSAVKNEWVE